MKAAGPSQAKWWVRDLSASTIRKEKGRSELLRMVVALTSIEPFGSADRYSTANSIHTCEHSVTAEQEADHAYRFGNGGVVSERGATQHKIPRLVRLSIHIRGRV